MQFSSSHSFSLVRYSLGVVALGGMLALLGWSAVAAQDRVYRCGNEYTNNPGDIAARGCRLVEGGNLTIVQGIKPKAAASAPAVGAGATSGARHEAERVNRADQNARDSDARAILEAELRKAEARLIELQREYNNGNPEKRGDEFRNHQRYLDRVAGIKASLARAESDVAGLKRELDRTVPAGTAAKAR